MQPDQLQNELLNLSHHLKDVLEALGRVHAKLGPDDVDVQMMMAGLSDMGEGIKRLNSLLPKGLSGEMDRMSPEDIASTMD